MVRKGGTEHSFFIWYDSRESSPYFLGVYGCKSESCISFLPGLAPKWERAHSKSSGVTPSSSNRSEINIYRVLQNLTCRRGVKILLFPLQLFSKFVDLQIIRSTGKSVWNTIRFRILTSIWSPGFENKRRVKSSPWYYYHVARQPVNWPAGASKHEILSGNELVMIWNHIPVDWRNLGFQKSRRWKVKLTAGRLIFLLKLTIDNTNRVSDDSGINICLCEVIIVLNSDQNISLITIGPVFTLYKAFQNIPKKYSKCIRSF